MEIIPIWQITVDKLPFWSKIETDYQKHVNKEPKLIPKIRPKAERKRYLEEYIAQKRLKFTT